MTRTICEKINLKIAEDTIVTGDDLDKLHDDEFAGFVEKYNVFCRVSPVHKYKIVKALNIGAQRTVGYIGDGINDAPALNASDVAISVNTGTSIAKEAADIILLNKNLNVLNDGIVEGRKTFVNITKYIVNTVSANFGNMFTVAFSSLFIRFIPMLPSQILLNNLITDGPMLTIATDRVDEQSLHKPKKLNIPMINTLMKKFGVVSSIFDLIIILTLVYVIKSPEGVFRSVWFFESALSELLITFSLRTQLPFYKSKPSGMLIWSSVVTALLLVPLLAVPSIATFFQFSPLTLGYVGLVLFIVVLYFAVVEIFKRRIKKDFIL